MRGLRSPLGGRNFESFSEDSLLTGKLASTVAAFNDFSARVLLLRSRILLRASKKRKDSRWTPTLVKRPYYERLGRLQFNCRIHQHWAQSGNARLAKLRKVEDVKKAVKGGKIPSQDYWRSRFISPQIHQLEWQVRKFRDAWWRSDRQSRAQ